MTMENRDWRCRTPSAVLPVVLVLIVSCGGDSGSGPGGVGPSQSGLSSGTVLTLVSGETGGPVAGASLTLGPQTLTSDAAGEVRLTAAAPIGTALDIVHPAYLNRQSTVRSGTGARFALWPRATGSGLSEHYTATIVYTAAGDTPTPTGDAAMTRLPRGTTTVVVVPSADLLADGAAMEAHYRGVAAVTEATGGAVTYALSPSRPSAGVVVTTRLDPQDSRCVEGGIRAYTRGTYQGLELMSSEIVFCGVGVSRSATIGHELGHTFGLRHSPDERDIMSFQFATSRATTFGPRESLVMRLMLDRPPGNRYPDNDRSATASTAASERVTVCY
jgi:hypothetical protein